MRFGEERDAVCPRLMVPLVIISRWGDLPRERLSKEIIRFKEKRKCKEVKNTLKRAR
jgi:hypothetical protein